MRLPPPRVHSRCRRVRGGFTLTETMVTMAIFLFVISGVMSSYMYGLKMFEITKPKLSASDDARDTISKLVGEIRSANIIRVGNGDTNTFTEVGVNSPQLGNAIKIFPTTDTNTYAIYYWDSGSQKLVRAGSDHSFLILCHSVTNQYVFTSEDFQGNVLTNNLNNRVIGLLLQFNQIQYPIMAIGPGNLYDFYELHTKITRRALF